jgi:hypothetical protein
VKNLRKIFITLKCALVIIVIFVWWGISLRGSWRTCSNSLSLFNVKLLYWTLTGKVFFTLCLGRFLWLLFSVVVLTNVLSLIFSQYFRLFFSRRLDLLVKLNKWLIFITAKTSKLNLSRWWCSLVRHNIFLRFIVFFYTRKMSM